MLSSSSSKIKIRRRKIIIFVFRIKKRRTFAKRAQVVHRENRNHSANYISVNSVCSSNSNSVKIYYYYDFIDTYILRKSRLKIFVCAFRECIAKWFPNIDFRRNNIFVSYDSGIKKNNICDAVFMNWRLVWVRWIIFCVWRSTQMLKLLKTKETISLSANWFGNFFRSSKSK